MSFVNQAEKTNGHVFIDKKKSKIKKQMKFG